MNILNFNNCPVFSIPDLAILALFISFLFYVIAKMAGKILEKTEIEAFAEVEKQNLFFVAIITFSFPLVFQAAGLLISEYLNRLQIYVYGDCPEKSVIEIAQNLLYSTLNNKLFPAFSSIIHIVHSFEIFSGYSIKAVGAPGVDVKQRITAGFDVVLSPLIIIRDLMPLLLSSVAFQIIFYDFSYVFYQYLFPVSLIFLALPITRQLGKELLAIIISFSFFMPFFHIILYVAFEDISKRANIAEETHISELKNIATKLLFIFSTTSLTIALSYTTLIDLLINSLFNVISIMAYASFVSVLIPTFVLITSITFVTTISKALTQIV